MEIAAAQAAESTGLSQALDEQTQIGKDDFLLLLVTQLQNQDPLSPMDSDAFVEQLTQMSSLEELQNLSETFSAFSSVTRMANATSLIGKDVTFPDPLTGATTNGTVTEIRSEEGNVYAMVDGQAVDVSTISAVALPQSEQATTASSN